MSNRSKHGFKGFAKPSNPTRKNLAPKTELSSQDIQKIIQIVRAVDVQTRINRSKLNALENFKKLVSEGNIEKLVAHFKQYGIDPELIKLNLQVFIEEELRDLS